MVKQYKLDEVSILNEKLKNKGNFILTNYSGIKVKNLTKLRDKLREKKADYKVVKNTLFSRALKESGYDGFEQFLKGPLGVVFVRDEIGEIAKLLKDFGKEEEKFSFTAGVLDKVVYNEAQIKQIADLPSKEVILSQVLSLINGPASGIAMGMNQIMASLARGIQAVAEANNKS